MTTCDSDVKMDTDTDDDGYYDDDYYNCEEVEVEPIDPSTSDPEYFEFKCLTREDVERFLNECVEKLCASLSIKPSIAKILLHMNSWAISDILVSYKEGTSKLLTDSRIKPEKSPEMELQAIQNSRSLSCSICLLNFSGKKFRSLACGHYFCKDCWTMHFEIQIFQGLSTTIECMGQDCSLLVPEDVALSILNKSSLKEKYRVFSFSDYIKSHPQLRFCPGPSCDLIIFAKDCQSKCVKCTQCKISFCFKCGTDYHAPTDCDTIKKWIIKCEDDSETANYISAHTKDCPKCNSCIEKSGGCNHMKCYACKQEFCWICLGDWKAHVGEHYQCSRYKENPNTPDQSARAREALKKYLFYYERWDNHAKSLKLEETTLRNITDGINKKVMANEGTWIDFQYLKDAGELLLKCRYTLQYTYPYVYFMQSSPRKQLFEYQQAQLEAEIENLSWKLEPAGIADRGELENQMDVAEKRRTTLLKDFLAV